MQEFKVDYHIHTIYSDGQSTPTHVVKQAKELDFDVIAITDHDNVNGVKEAMIAGEAVDLKVVPGIEIATQTEEGIGVHLLGYGFDPENGEMQELLRQLIQNRIERNEKLLAVLSTMGYEFSPEELQTGKDEFIGKPVIARGMVAKGYIREEREAYGRNILGSPQCRAVRKKKPLVAEAIRIVTDAGGIPVFAHPMQTRGLGRPGSEEFYDHLNEQIARMKKQGLKGMECFYPEHSEDETMRLVAFAEKYHLHMTRGTDFHGADYIEANRTGRYR